MVRCVKGRVLMGRMLTDFFPLTCHLRFGYLRSFKHSEPNDIQLFWTRDVLITRH
jgi:hypothetical protein